VLSKPMLPDFFPASACLMWRAMLLLGRLSLVAMSLIDKPLVRNSPTATMASASAQTLHRESFTNFLESLTKVASRAAWK